MQINIYDWANAVGEERLAPYMQNDVLDGDRATVHRLVDHFLDKNLNVMIRQYDGGVLIYVDTKMFQTR